jgi:superfamily II DNA or RNA helicase
MDPRPYQTAAIEAVQASPHQRTIVTLPTGCGKTVMGLLLAKMLRARTLWIAHRDELITQPAETLPHVWPDAESGIVKAQQNQAFARDIVFASIQTIQNPVRLEVLRRTGGFDLVVADECHHATAPSWLRTLEGLGCFAEGGPRLVGLTATTERADQARLDKVFQGVAYQYHLHQAIQAGYLVPPTIATHKFKLDLSGVHTRGGDFRPEELDVALLRAGIIKAIGDAWQTHATGRRGIVFVISVKQAQDAAAELERRGVPATWISGELATPERRRRLADFRAGKYRAMVNCMVLTEGFDDPGVDCVLMARPTKSKPLYIQMGGRGLRLYPGKTDCLIIDMAGLSGRHTLVQAPAIFGLEDEAEKRSRKKPGEGFEMSAEEYWRRRLKSQVEGVAGMARSSLNWLEAKAGVFALPCGEFGTVVLRHQWENLYLAEVVGREGAPGREPLAAEPVTLELAQGIAEDYTRRVGDMGRQYNSRQARWRSGPATSNQIEALKRWGVEIPPELTKGTASDILSAKKATAREYEPATPKQLRALKALGVKEIGLLTKGEATRAINVAKAKQTEWTWC